MELIDPSRLTFAGNFNRQVEEIINYVKMTEVQCKNNKMLIKHLHSVLLNVCEDFQIEEFGATVTGIAFKNSDIDCLVNISDSIRKNPVQLVLRTQDCLNKSENFVNITTNTKNRNPKVNFQHILTKTFCDVSFTGRGAVKVSLLLQYLASIDERIPPLMFIIKYWAKINQFTGRFLMSNYCLMLLIIFFLQKERILPTIEFLQRNIEAEYTDNWNTAFARMTYFSNNQKSVYKLLGDFFCFYSKVNFKTTIISVYTGKLINRQCFASDQSIPKDYDIYFENVYKDNMQGLALDTPICVQDCFDHARNSGFTVKHETAEFIIKLVKHAALVYERESKDCFLSNLLVLPTSKVKKKPRYRRPKQQKPTNRPITKNYVQ